MKEKNIAGKKFNMLTAIREIKNERNACIWQFQCDCGIVCEKRKHDVMNGKTKSCCQCGYSKKRTTESLKLNLTGKKFGRYTVIEQANNRICGRIAWICKCKCGNVRTVTSNCLRSGKTKSCGCYHKEVVIKNCRIDLVGKRFGNFIVLSYSHTYKKQPFWLCKCDCGSHRIYSSGNLKNNPHAVCGHCNRPKIGDILGKLEVVEIQLNTKVCRVKCRCDCGRYREDNWAKLKSGNFKTCGKCKKYLPTLMNDITNIKFGKLTAIRRLNQTFRRAYIWECKCECGNLHYAPIGYLTSGDTKSCGNCNNTKNGIKYSFIQIDVSKIVESIINKPVQINFWTKNRKRNIDIAFQINGQKFAIEYDGSYWHDLQIDRKKTKYLVRNNWKVLRIQSNEALPTKEELSKALSILSNTDRKQYTLKLSDWKNSSIKGAV